ncbi:MAG: HK97 family phage prohead protease [Deltaproteobacteria bacterium]|nr:HK97 family phage prohead protease [Deltaproteobacteria bacterium]
MKEIQKQLFYRSTEFDRSRVDQKKRSVDLAFSSETPIPRWFGREILLHGSKNVDLSRLKSMGTVLMNHNPDIIVGPVKNPRIEDKKGRATIGFDNDEDGERAMQKVLSGSLRGVSVGYRIIKAREVLKDEEYEGIEGPALIALRWMPYEISLTPIPADATVGIGRELTRSLEGIDIERSKTTKEDKVMIKRNKPLIDDEGTRELWGLLFRVAEMVGGFQLKSRVSDSLCDGNEEDVLRMLNNELDLRVTDPDKGPGNRVEEIMSFNQIDDDLFFRSFADPALFPPLSGGSFKDDPGLKKETTRVTSFKQISDDAFARGIANPSLF